jgi:hypothetical protein
MPFFTRTLHGNQESGIKPWRVTKEPKKGGYYSFCESEGYTDLCHSETGRSLPFSFPSISSFISSITLLTTPFVADYQFIVPEQFSIRTAVELGPECPEGDAKRGHDKLHLLEIERDVRRGLHRPVFVCHFNNASLSSKSGFGWKYNHFLQRVSDEKIVPKKKGMMAPVTEY